MYLMSVLDQYQSAERSYDTGWGGPLYWASGSAAHETVNHRCSPSSGSSSANNRTYGS
jgi:hypothetical protein